MRAMSPPRLSLQGFWRSRRGVAAVEFAFIGPIMILMAAATIELGMAVQCQYAAAKLASQYAVAWADCKDLPAGTCQTEMATYTSSSTIANIAPQLDAASLKTQMFQVAMSGGNVTATYSYPSGTSLSTAQSSAASAVIANGQNGVVVTVTYTYNLKFFGGLFASGSFAGVIPTSFPMSYTIAQLKA